MKNIFEELESVLTKNNKFLDENNKLIKEKIKTAAIQMDADLISLLLENDALKSRFFVEVNGVYVFDRNEFMWLVSNREFLPNSYTSYKNKIGLVNDGGQFIKNTNDVCLSFPFKDCFLVGDQKKDDEKRNEVFFNTRIIKDEIDVLTSTKAF